MNRNDSSPDGAGAQDSTRCVVTGASGTLASFLVRKLVRQGCAVAILVRESSDLRRIADLVPRLTIIRTDLSSFDDAARAALREFAPDVAFHLAWQGVNRDARDSPDQIHVNIPMTLSVFREVEAAGARCWVGLGSVSEYGDSSVPCRESATPRPVSAYGIAKHAAGAATRVLCELAGMRYVWARLFLIYGAADDEHRLIPTVIRSLQSGQTPALSHGEQLLDFLHGDDAADGLWTLASHPAADGIFNVASGEPHSVREVAELIRDVVAPSATLGFGRIAHRSPEFHGADIARVRAVVGWTPRMSLRDGLIDTAAWFAKNPPVQRDPAA